MFQIISVFYISKLKNPQIKKIVIKTEARISDSNINNLKQALLAVYWSALHPMSFLPPIFLSNFIEICELPVVNKNIRIFLHILKNHKPLITSGILKSIHCKHHLYKTFIQNKDSKSASKYKTYKNKLTRIIRMAKKM